MCSPFGLCACFIHGFYVDKARLLGDVIWNKMAGNLNFLLTPTYFIPYNVPGAWTSSKTEHLFWIKRCPMLVKHFNFTLTCAKKVNYIPKPIVKTIISFFANLLAKNWCKTHLSWKNPAVLKWYHPKALLFQVRLRFGVTPLWTTKVHPASGVDTSMLKKWYTLAFHFSALMCLPLMYRGNLGRS